MECLKATKGLLLSELTNDVVGFTGNNGQKFAISGYQKLWNILMLKFGVKYHSTSERDSNMIDTLNELVKEFPTVPVNVVVYASSLLIQGKLTDSKGEILKAYQAISIVSLADLIHAFRRYEKALFSDLIKSGKLYLDEEPNRPTESDMQNLFITELKQALELNENLKPYDKVGLDVFVYDKLFELGFAIDYKTFMQKAKIKKQNNLIDINKRAKSVSISSQIKAIAMSDADSNTALIATAKEIALNESLTFFNTEIKEYLDGK